MLRALLIAPQNLKVYNSFMFLTSVDLDYFQKFGFDTSEAARARNQKTKVVMGMSGGVDSSVAALILLAEGYDVLGVFMKNWEDDSEFCQAEQDFQDVVAVCEKIGINYYSINFAEEYYQDVFETFLTEYKKGRTPNPDILCNSEIKFDVFYKYAKSLGANYLATGHYAQIKKLGESHFLKKGEDDNKDQSYFLYRVDEQVWPNILFPLGRLTKPQVREIAKKYELATSKKKDSMGICFIGEKNFKEFLSRYIDNQKGFFKTLAGEVVGDHNGQCFYTAGQRKGLGLGGPGEPWYVVKKDLSSNDVIVERGEHPALFVDDLTCSEVTGKQLQEASELSGITCKVRHRQADQECEIKRDGSQFRVYFKNPQRGIASGQSIVFYQDNICLGGAIIEEVGLSHYDKQKDLNT